MTNSENADLVPLLEYVDEEKPPYFNPDVDIEIYNEQEEEWEQLMVSERNLTLPTLIEVLRRDEFPVKRVRFADTTARDYLFHLTSTGFDDRLHFEDQMNRERVVKLAEAGYTEVDDFLGMADPIDIGKESGVDRDIITNIATNYLGGFSAASSFGEETEGALAGLEPSDRFSGWSLTRDSEYVIRWVSEGRFQVTISPNPDDSVALTSNLPNVDQHPFLRKGWSIGLDGIESSRAEEVLDQAHEWLERNQLEFEDDLTEVTYIGTATRDYLGLEYGVISVSDLEEFIRTQPDEFEAIFGKNATDVRSSILTTE